MINLPPDSRGYPVTIAPINPSAHSQNSPIPPPPFSSPLPPNFPQPKFTSDASPLVRSPSMISHSNGARDGSPVQHISTPPGPPVFSSPVRPSAVPFRVSPVTPQPVPFSSGTSLPPHFLNGSVTEFERQVSNVVDETHTIDEAAHVLFSAHKVLKLKKQANIPSLGFGALVCPGREISSGPQIIQRDPHRCQNCGAYSNVYCKILLGSGQWQCVVCRNLNGSDGEYIASSKEELCSFPELSSPIVDFIQNGSMRPGFIPVSDTRISTPIILVIDECLGEQHLQHLQSSLHAFVNSLPPTTRIGIILYSRMISVYDFGERFAASADVLPGEKSPTVDDLKNLIHGMGIYLSLIRDALPVVNAIISSLRPYKLEIPETLRDRCLGAAVEVAVAIIKGPSAEITGGVVKRVGGNSRIIVCAGGPNTFGPGSVPHSMTHPNYPHLEKIALKYMETLGKKALRHDIVVDILCAGTSPVRVPILQPLAKASGGVLVLHDDFGGVLRQGHRVHMVSLKSDVLMIFSSVKLLVLARKLI